MKVTFPVSQKRKCIKIPNALILNRFTFCIFKLIFGLHFNPLLKIKYKHIKPIVKKAKSYKGYEIVNINTRQGENIIISL